MSISSSNMSDNGAFGETADSFISESTLSTTNGRKPCSPSNATGFILDLRPESGATYPQHAFNKRKARRRMLLLVFRFSIKKFTDTPNVPHRLKHLIGVNPMLAKRTSNIMIHFLLRSQSRRRFASGTHCYEVFVDLPGMYLLLHKQAHHHLKVA